MWRRKLKVRLLQYVAKKLRAWAVSLERNVPQEEQAVADTTPDPLSPGSGGPPQHWLDLVREKAPELLSLPRTEPFAPQKSSQPEIQQTERASVKEPKPKPPLLKFPKPPGALRNQSVSKARAFTRSRFLTLKQSRKSEPPAEPVIEVPRAVRSEDQSAASGSSPLEIRKPSHEVEEHRSDTSQAVRSQRLPEPHTRGDSGSIETDPGFVEHAKKRRQETSVYPQSNRAVSEETISTAAVHGKREFENQPPRIVKGNRPPYGPMVEPRRRSGSPERIATELSGSFRIDRRARAKALEVESHTVDLHKIQQHIHVAPASSPVNPAAQPSRTRPEAYWTIERSAPNKATIINYSLIEEDDFDNAQINMPALVDEETMSAAAAAHWPKTTPSENPWPDLPTLPPLEIEDELASHARELDRYRRLELEQRGTLWNE